jgi:hypothetical protein
MLRTVEVDVNKGVYNVLAVKLEGRRLRSVPRASLKKWVM